MAVLPVVVKGGFWGELGGLTLYNTNTLNRRIARLFKRPSMAKQRELAETLNGAAAGAAALATHKQVSARENSQGELGGRRTIETVTDVNRNTTVADETQIDTEILTWDLDPTYVANKNKNPRGTPGSV